MRQFITEEEAKAKWCPMVRDGEFSGGNSFFTTINPEHRVPNWALCVGARCMFWGIEQTVRRVDDYGTIKSVPTGLGRCEKA